MNLQPTTEDIYSLIFPSGSTFFRVYAPPTHVFLRDSNWFTIQCIDGASYNAEDVVSLSAKLDIITDDKTYTISGTIHYHELSLNLSNVLYTIYNSNYSGDIIFRLELTGATDRETSTTFVQVIPNIVISSIKNGVTLPNRSHYSERSMILPPDNVYHAFTGETDTHVDYYSSADLFIGNDYYPAFSPVKLYGDNGCHTQYRVVQKTAFTPWKTSPYNTTYGVSLITLGATRWTDKNATGKKRLTDLLTAEYVDEQGVVVGGDEVYNAYSRTNQPFKISGFDYTALPITCYCIPDARGYRISFSRGGYQAYTVASDGSRHYEPVTAAILAWERNPLYIHEDLCAIDWKVANDGLTLKVYDESDECIGSIVVYCTSGVVGTTDREHRGLEHITYHITSDPTTVAMAGIPTQMHAIDEMYKYIYFNTDNEAKIQVYGGMIGCGINEEQYSQIRNASDLEYIWSWCNHSFRMSSSGYSRIFYRNMLTDDVCAGMLSSHRTTNDYAGFTFPADGRDSIISHLYAMKSYDVLQYINGNTHFTIWNDVSTIEGPLVMHETDTYSIQTPTAGNGITTFVATCSSVNVSTPNNSITLADDSHPRLFEFIIAKDTMVYVNATELIDVNGVNYDLDGSITDEKHYVQLCFSQDVWAEMITNADVEISNVSVLNADMTVNSFVIEGASTSSQACGSFPFVCNSSVFMCDEGIQPYESHYQLCQLYKYQDKCRVRKMYFYLFNLGEIVNIDGELVDETLDTRLYHVSVDNNAEIKYTVAPNEDYFVAGTFEEVTYINGTMYAAYTTGVQRRGIWSPRSNMCVDNRANTLFFGESDGESSQFTLNLFNLCDNNDILWIHYLNSDGLDRYAFCEIKEREYKTNISDVANIYPTMNVINKSPKFTTSGYQERLTCLFSDIPKNMYIEDILQSPVLEACNARGDVKYNIAVEEDSIIRNSEPRQDFVLHIIKKY